MSETTESGATAGRPAPSSSEPQNPLGRMSEQVRQAGEQAASLAEEARISGASLVDDVKERVLSAAEGQREGIAGQISDVAETIHRSGEHFKGKQDWIAQIVEGGAQELGTLAATLRTNDLQELMGKLEDLARRQPALFVGAAMAAGFAMVRLGKVAVSGASKADLPTMPEVAHEPE
jgi:hypothetical protein